MAIVTDEYLEYDYDEHFYYLTEAGLTKYTGYTDLLAIWTNPALRLKKQGRLLHEKCVQSPYNMKQTRYKHKDIIEYKVFKNEHGERDAIIKSLTIIAELANDMEWDKYILSEETKWFPSILRSVSEAGVYYLGQFLSYVPEDEYQVGY